MVTSTRERVVATFHDSATLKQDSAGLLAPLIEAAAEAVCETLLAGGKILCCGNGGSASDAQHFAGEMVNRFERERPGLPVIALTCDSAVLTAIGNDDAYEQVFARQVQALAMPNDLLLAITTSGNSLNVVRAIEAAHAKETRVLALSGGDGGAAALALQSTDIELRIPSNQTPRIQELHILCLHCLCDLVDWQLLGDAAAP